MIDSISSYLSEIAPYLRDMDDLYWFRGLGSHNFKLKPSLYRHPTIVDETEIHALERKLITRFKERSIPYLPKQTDSNWEIMFIMQHYGLPTRLLDWTENPLIALFFALSSNQPDPTTNSYSDKSLVWILSPKKWNETVFNHVTYKGAALSISDRLINPYDPMSVDNSPAMPAAIWGLHNSPRIVAQRGTFTIFGSKNTPMEEMITTPTFPANTLAKIEIEPTNVKKILDEMIASGQADTMVYPGLDGLAKEMKRIFGFGGYYV
jgi:hypothetical protein